jgi:hypothetical protein
VFSDASPLILWQNRYFPKNMKTLPIFSIALILTVALISRAHSSAGSEPVAVAKAAAPAPPVGPVPSGGPSAGTTSAPQPDPLTVLHLAREKLTAPGVRSIKSRIIERVSIGNRRFRAEGSYVQGTDLRLRLELKTVSEAQHEGIDGSFLEVCDGTILWTRHQLGSESRITRRDVRQILGATKGTEQNLLSVELGLGGLPAYLASLERAMKFDSLAQEEISGKKFVVLTGKWNDATFEGYKSLLGKKRVPEHIPDSVRIYLDADILFPRRIAFLKNREPGSLPEAMVELDFIEIVINGPTDLRKFEFVPPQGMRTVDVTNEYLLRLKSAASK